MSFDPPAIEPLPAKPPLPPGASTGSISEATRLARLRELAVLDTEPEPLFDHITSWAAEAIGMPIALISLIDEDRQWFKSRVGLDARETARDIAFCNHTIQQSGVMVVPDAHFDARFAANPLVLGDPHIRFYAGAPIEMPGGERVGTLCVVDRSPRSMSADQQALLRRLAGMAAQTLLMRESTIRSAGRSMRRLEAELAIRDAALVDSERLFREISELSPVGVFYSDGQGACTYTNGRWQKIYGLTLAQSLGNGWADGIHPEDRGLVYRTWRERVADQREFTCEHRVVRPDGVVRHVQARSLPVPAAGGKVTAHVGVVIDVTEMVTIQQRLRASEALLDRAGQLAGVGGWEFDLREQRLTWTDQTCRIHDVPLGHQPSLEEAIRYYAPDARSVVESAVQRAIRDGTPWDLELPLMTAQGRNLWVRAHGEVEFESGVAVRLFGAIQDITQRHTSEARLNQQRHSLRVLYDSSPAMLMSLDQGGAIITITDHCLRHFGWKRGDVVGQLLLYLMHGEGAVRWREQGLATLFKAERLERVTALLVDGDGGLRHVLITAVVDIEPISNQRRALVVLNDVTEDLAQRAELQREQHLRLQVQTHAQELQRLLSERSEMLDVLAHEVRQPLNNASAALQSASAELQGQGQGAAVTRVRRAQNVLGEVLSGVDNTLAAASLLVSGQQLQKQDMEIDTLVDLVVADLPLDRRDRIEVEMLASVHSVPMDLGLMRLALRNLLLNALRYSPEAAPVRLRIRDECPAGTHPGTSPAGTWSEHRYESLGLVLEVIDAGPGFDEQARAQLFKRGGKGRRGGNGLGLHIAHRVMALHAGRLELAESGPTGSTLAMHLPRSH